MIPKILVCNIPVHLFSVNSLHNAIYESISKKRRTLFLHANARLIELANTEHTWLEDFFSNTVDYVMCDGAGIQLAAKLSHQPIPQKIAYNIWIWQFLKFAASHNFSFFFLGADKETIDRSITKMKTFEPSLQIVGWQHGFFDKTQDSSENVRTINRINQVNPDILLIGFGMPMQEMWVRDNFKDINARAIFTCGGAFDFISGKNKVAPAFIRKLYLEWLYRFTLEPSRLFNRVFFSNTKFLIVLVNWLMRRRKLYKFTKD